MFNSPRFSALCAAAGLFMLLGGCSSEPTSTTPPEPLPAEKLIQGEWNWIRSNSFVNYPGDTPGTCKCTRKLVITQGAIVSFRNGAVVDSVAYAIMFATPGTNDDARVMITDGRTNGLYEITGRDTLLVAHTGTFTSDSYVRK